MGALENAALEAVMRAAPAPPRTIAETGLAVSDVLNLAIKAIYVSGEATPSMIGHTLKLPPSTVNEIFEQAEERRLLIGLGATSRDSAELRYALSDKGAQWAHEAMRQSQYVGPAPVTLEGYRDRIGRQRIASERVDEAAIAEAFGDLVISTHVAREIGPAINSGRSILLYGPPGNGKTSVGERIGSIFRDVICIPYCFEVDGQIIKVFDPGIHRPVNGQADQAQGGATTFHRDEFDARWVACWRPLVIAGGELTLEMLDLRFNSEAKFYEAPAHIKALGGVFMIDDFGRQLVSPTALLNRCIVPMESRVDYLKLHTGKSFSLPFDELVIFCTNLSPSALMDPAFLRRIPYKIEMAGPSAEEYRKIFHMCAKASGLEAPERVIDDVIWELCERSRFPLASYQPRFVVDQIQAACRFEGIEPEFRAELVAMALSNLYTRDTPGFGDGPAVNPGAARAA